MLAKLNELAQRAYHPGALHKANPCDLGGARWLRPFGRALRHLGSECGCCSGARVLFVALLALAAPTLTAIGVVLWFLAAAAKELWCPTPEFQEAYDAYDAYSESKE